MLSLSTEQADLANRSDHVTVPLVVLTTYLGTIYYWSTVGVHYDWNGDGDQYFRGVIAGISALEHSMPHLALARGNQIGTPTLRIDVVNEEIEGDSLWKSLTTTNLRPFATVEYAEILVNPDRWNVEGGAAWWDLRDMDGDEHTYLFRGEFVGGEIVEDDHTFALNFETPEPEVPLVELLDEDTNDPRDFGSYLPIVYGAAKRVPCKNIEVGWETTLAEPLGPSDTGSRRVTDASGFPTATTFDFLAGKEIIRCSGSDHDGNTVTITTRGYGKTTATQHFAGEFVVELLDEVVIGLAGNKCGVIRRLYLESPHTGDLVRFLVPITLTNEDTAAIAGETISTARIPQEDLVGTLLAMNASPRVTVQPVHSYTGDSSPQSDEETPTDQTVEARSRGIRGYWTDVDTTSPQWNYDLSYGYERLRCEWTGSLDNSYEVLKWRVSAAISVSNIDSEAGIHIYPHEISGMGSDKLECIATENGAFSKDFGWVTPDPGTTMLDLVSDNSYFNLYGYIDSWSGSYPTVHVTTISIEAELDAITSSVDREVDVAIEAGSVGAGLRFYADIDGYGVPYTFSEGYDYEDNETWATTNCTSTRIDASPTPSEGTYARKVTASGAGAVETQITGLTSNKDLDATDDRYRISLYAGNPELLDTTVPIQIWFSDSSTGASGTSPPTNRYEIQIDPFLLVHVEWVHLEVTAYDITGSSSVDDIDTVGMSFEADSGAPYIVFDDLRVADASNANYSPLSPGDLIEKMPDIARHFIADHCELGHSAVDDTTFDLALTRLDDNEYAGPVTVYGTRFEDILEGMALEGRGNIVREEGSSGGVYGFHVSLYSGNTYPYSASVRTLTEWNRLTERTRPADLCATRFRAFWKWDPFLGYGEDSFTRVSRGDKVVNDTLLTAAGFTAAELVTGQRDADPIALYLVRDEETAEDVLGFYAYQSLDTSHVEITLVSPYSESYDVQRGDIVSLTPSWAGSARKCRVVGVRSEFQTPVRTLTLVEV